MLVETLTPGERLWLLRRRRRLTIDEAASEYKVSRWLYGRWETDQAEGPDPELDIVEPYEHYALLRRRAGMTQKDLAQLIGLSPRRISYMELGDYPYTHLMLFWEGRQ
jgi:transcriptional regulator with XRE-family HTH domain